MGLIDRIRRFVAPKPPSALRRLASEGLHARFGRDRDKPTRSPRALVDSFVEVAYSCAIINASAVASARLRVFSSNKREAEKKYSVKGIGRRQASWIDRSYRKATKIAESVEIEDHPAMKLLEESAGFMDCYTLIWLSQLYLEIVGRFVWLLDDETTELWMIPAHLVEPVFDDDRIVTGYKRVGTTNDKEIPLQELVVGRFPSLHNPYTKDWSPAQAAAQSIGLIGLDLDLAQSLMMTRARPDLWVWPKDGDMDEDQAIRLYAQMRTMAKQQADSGVVVSEVPLDTLEIGYSSREQDQMTRVQAHTDRIHNAFMVPVSLTTKSTNLANLTAGLVQHSRMAVIPRLTMLCQMLNKQLMPRFGGDAFVWFDDPVPEDVEKRAKVHESQIRTGERYINELRREDGLPPVEWGDEPPVGMGGYFPLDPEERDRARGKKDRSSGSSDDSDDDGGDREKALRAMEVAAIGGSTDLVKAKFAEAGVEYSLKQVGGLSERDFGEEERDEAPNDLVPTAPIESFEEALREFFGDQRRALLKLMVKSLVKAAGDELPKFDLSKLGWDAEMVRRAFPFVELFANAGIEAVQNQIGVGDMTVVPQKIEEALRRASLKFAESTNATTSMQLERALEKLRQDLANGIVHGANTPAELTRIVQAIFDRAEEFRARRIALTEASRATHFGYVAGLKETGIVPRIDWLTSSHPCPICQEIADKYPDGVPIDQGFGRLSDLKSVNYDVDPAYDKIDHPPAHPHCKCSLTARIDESALAPGLQAA